MAKLYRGMQKLEPFDELHADLDGSRDRGSIRFQLNVRCEIVRFSHSLGRLKAGWFVLLAVSLMIGAAYAADIDPLPIIKELLAGGLRE